MQLYLSKKKKVKQYPTAIDLGSENLFSTLKMKVEGGQPESAIIKSDALRPIHKMHMQIKFSTDH